MGLSEDLEKIASQERELHLPRVDAQIAWDLGTRIRAMAVERGLTLVIDVRRFGQPLFYAALDGTTPDNAEWVRRKSNVVARFHRSSYAVGMTLKVKGTTLAERYGLPVADYAADGGSFPLTCRERGHRRQRDRVRPAAARRSQPGCGSAVRFAREGFCGIAAGTGDCVAHAGSCIKPTFQAEPQRSRQSAMCQAITAVRRPA